MSGTDVVEDSPARKTEGLVWPSVIDAVVDVEASKGDVRNESALLSAFRRCLFTGVGSFLMSLSSNDNCEALVQVDPKTVIELTQDGGDIPLVLWHVHTACASKEKPRTRSTWWIINQKVTGTMQRGTNQVTVVQCLDQRG
jgi:hypothetical protein